MNGQDEFDDWPDTTPVTGSAQVIGESDDDEPPIGTLYLPDPTSRSGWSMRHVWRKAPKPERRRMGFYR